MHNTYALEIRGPDYLLENMKVHNYGDCIAVLEAGDRFHISGMRCSQIRDDFVSDDLGWSGIVEDSLFDGGYVFFSDRGNRVAASDAVVEIKNNLVRLQVFDQTFNHGEVGHGWFWKLDADAVKISLHGNIFFTNEASIHGSHVLIPEKIVSCKKPDGLPDNIIVWTGSGDYPRPKELQTGCFTLTTDRAVWDTAIANWQLQH